MGSLAVFCLLMITVMAQGQYAEIEYQSVASGITKHKLSTLFLEYNIETSSNLCLPNCIVCNPNNVSQCQQCQVGYVLQTNYQCQPCSHGCIACRGTQTCVQCNSGFLLISEGYVGTCIRCPQGCSTCQAISFQTMFITQNINCKSCYPGFYKAAVPGFSSLYGCVACLAGCSTCQNSTSCLSCVAGFGFNQASGSCYVCQPNCLRCSPDVGCQLCTLGYFINPLNSSSLTCSPCQLNCVQCPSSTQCIRCVPGYYPVSQINIITNITTSFCKSCPPPCSICYSQLVCLSCPRGFFLNITQVQVTNTTTNQTTPTIESAICQSCVAFCDSCINSSLCQTCQVGYYQTTQGLCQSCGSACHSCISSTQCFECMGSFYLSGGACKPCSVLCSMCNVTLVNNVQQQVCYNCTSVSYAPLNGKCTACLQITDGCLTCLSPTQCLTCSQNYNLVEGSCLETYGGLGVVYVVLFCIAGAIGVAAMVFGVWACWRHRSGYGAASEDSNPGLRASYYQIP